MAVWFSVQCFLPVIKKGKVVDIKYDVTKFHFGRHRVTMIYHRFTILSIPAVNCTVGNTKERLNKEEPYRMLDDLI